jgi:hypothetical protein
MGKFRVGDRVLYSNIDGNGQKECDGKIFTISLADGCYYKVAEGGYDYFSPSEFRLKLVQQYGCKSNCKDCRGKCSLWEAE